MGRPKKTEEGSEKILHKKFWIWDAVWEEPRHAGDLAKKCKHFKLKK